MRTRYKITIIALSAFLGFLFLPIVGSNLYCDYISDSCNSRITGVGPGGIFLPEEWGTTDKCYMYPDDFEKKSHCRIDIGVISWPFPPRNWESEHETNCDEICPDDEIYKPSLEQLQMVFNYCNDTSEFKNAIGIEYFNSTHYINNNLCKWQVLEKYPNSDRLCIPGQDYSDEEIRNDTHIYNRDKCSWEEEFSWEKEWGGKFQEPNNKVKENE